jgi:hypothetical protein
LVSDPVKYGMGDGWAHPLSLRWFGKEDEHT